MFERADISAQIIYDGTLTAWDDRVIRWPVIRRDILGGLSNIVSVDLELADTDLKIYGSFSGTSPFNKEIAIITTITDQGNFGANLLQEGDFEGGLTGWQSNDANIIFNRTNVTPIADSWSGTLTYDLAYWSAGYQDFTIGSGTTYEISFLAKEIHPDLQFGVYNSSSHVTKWTGWTTDIDVTGADVGTYRSQFTSGAAGVAYFCWLMKQTGASVATAWLDNCVVRTVGITQTATQFVGRVTDLAYHDNAVRLTVRDNLDRLRNARFIFDYSNLSFVVSGKTYGTVTGVTSNTITFTDVNAFKLRTNRRFVDPDVFSLVSSAAQGNRHQYSYVILSYTDYMYANQILNDDIIDAGAMVKFAEGSYGIADAKDYLAGSIAYRVESGTIIGGSNGTLVLDAPNPIVQPGWFIYVQQPLILSGNPGEIVNTMLTGTNTSVGWSSANINTDMWGTGTVTTAQILISKKITNENAGGVLSEINSLNDNIGAISYVDEDGLFCWQPFGPFDYPAGLTDYGTDYTQQMSSYNKRSDDIISDLTAKYAWLFYDSVGDEQQYSKSITGTNDTVISRYSSRNYSWIHDDNLANVLMKRELLRYADAVGQFSFRGPISLGTIETGGDVLLTHRISGLSQDYFRLFSKEVDIGRSSIDLNFKNSDEYYLGRGFGWVEDSSGVHDCSGTSTGAWAWYTGSNGELTRSFGVGTGTLYCTNDGGIGSGAYVVVEDEIVRVTGDLGGGTYSILKGRLTTAEALHGSATRIISFGAGTEPPTVFDGYSGTVLNISEADHGTVYKWW